MKDEKEINVAVAVAFTIFFPWTFSNWDVVLWFDRRDNYEIVKSECMTNGQWKVEVELL